MKRPAKRVLVFSAIGGLIVAAGFSISCIEGGVAGEGTEASMCLFVNARPSPAIDDRIELEYENRCGTPIRIAAKAGASVLKPLPGTNFYVEALSFISFRDEKFVSLPAHGKLKEEVSLNDCLDMKASTYGLYKIRLQYDNRALPIDQIDECQMRLRQMYAFVSAGRVTDVMDAR